MGSYLFSNMSSHGKQEITDPVEEMLKKTGCIDLHYKVQVKNLARKIHFNYPVSQKILSVGSLVITKSFK